MDKAPAGRTSRPKPPAGSSFDPADIGRWVALGVIIFLVVAAFWRWLVPGILTYGDWQFLPTEYLHQYLPLPLSWSTYYTGLGQYAHVEILTLPINLLEGWLAHLGFSFAVIERLLYFIPFMVLAPLGTYRLFWYLFGRRQIAAVGALFYTVNTYTVMEFASSGHVPSGVAYALTPWIIWLAIRAWEQNRWSDRVLTGLIIALQTQYDIRFTYLTAGVFLSYVLFHLLYVRRPSVANQLKRLSISVLTIAGIVFILELYWILPAILAHGTAPTAPDVNLNPGWIKALSFMSFGHALAFFHPFWGVLNLSEPQPVPWYFYTWPLLAFGAGLTIWYLPKPKSSVATGDWRVVWLAFLALASAFLVMGTKAPLAGVYEWLFLHLFGFNAFRDPSKHFMALALAYAGLIGVTVYAATRWLTTAWPAYRSWVRFVPLGVFAVVLVITMHRLYFLNLNRTFTNVSALPADYTALANLSQHDQQQFYRILWVPTAQRFGRYLPDHPSIDANQLGQKELKAFLTDRQRTESWLENPNAEYLLSAMSIKYVVVPDDLFDEIFRYHDTSRDSFIGRLDTLPFLKRLPNFGSLAVYENRSVAEHLYPAQVIDYFADREARVNFPELDRLTGQTAAVDRPALMFWGDYAVTTQPRYGWELPDMGRSEQHVGSLKVPFRVPVGDSYQLWTHRNNQDLSVDSATVITGSGTTVFHQDDPGRSISFTRRGTPVYGPTDSQTADLLQSEFVQLGTVALSPGSYELQIADSTIQDDSGPVNASFEQPVQDGLATSSDHTDGRRSLQLSGRRELERTALAVTNFDSTATYRVTFDYKNVSGEAPWYSLDRVGIKDSPPASLPIQGHTWQRFSAVVPPGDNSTGFQLGLLSAGRPGAFTINRFDNVRIARVDGVDTMFVRTVNSSVPQVTFDRRSPIHYTAHVRGARNPFYLIFAEAYHPGWKLTIRSQPSFSADRTHTMMNGYANAWYLDRTGDYDAEIEFTPQRWVMVGTLLSAGALVIVLGWLGLALKRRW